MSDWQQFTLGDIGKIITGKTPSTTAEDNFGDEYMFITPRDMYGQKYVRQTERNLSEKGLNTVLRNSVPANSICVSCIGSDMGKVVLSTERSVTNQQINSIVVEEQDVEYVYYNLLLRQDEIKSGASGSAVPIMNKSTFSQLPINLPPLPEQKAIAHILGTLDEKIELNRQMNQTLEAMAQALFKSWFVDFDPVMDNALAAGNEIPDELQAMAEKRRSVIAKGNVIANSDEGGVKQSHRLLDTNPQLAAQFPSSFVFNETLGKWIPEGWEVKSLGKLIKLIGGGTPKTSIEEYWYGNIPWFSVVDAPNDSDVFVIDTEKKVSDEGIKNSSAQILREGTTIISARGTVGKCAIVGVPMAMNQSCYGIQNLNENEDIFTYLLVRKNVSDLQNKSHGSVFSTITRDTFNAIDVVVPKSGKVINVFESSLKYNFENIKSNLFENQTLIQLRDRLLPELISGRVRVGNGNQYET
ncbi:restriction endonuclease subunit S [Algoriphagus halophytocola]|uniref:Restriction endonuclease subunit S n=1 Tax=Algoriphagus halophytocola TaxID=2991499 RepID=A0ABY6MKM4_9BACT|nr:restriction endonuclease subunit S [Algoriphagus sp. TR-M5]UZD22957.1 restriction endonuclease subunit S [Algoriphagus sp. TR-M5]